MSDLRNRITEIRKIRASELLANPKNWREHPDRQRQAMKGLLQELGVADVLRAYIDEQGRVVLLDGHLRRDIDPDYVWDVLILDFTEAEAERFLLTYDPVAALAATNKALMEDLFSRQTPGDKRVDALLDDIARDNKIALAPPLDDPGASVDRAAELLAKWQVCTGDIWQLGDHRLACGDCTVREVVNALMGDERAALAPVDPPYNVGFDYDGETVDDEKTSEKYEQFSRAWFAMCQEFSERQIVTPGYANMANWLSWFRPFYVSCWTKTNAMTRGYVSQFFCWEPVLFFGGNWKRKRANDVFAYNVSSQTMGDGEVLTPLHPCPKPLEMWVDLLENFSEPGDVILETFGGSGTTLIAAQRTGRKSRLIEISPAYCSVILERWSVMTGETPVRISTHE